jgi:SAM-dependent methyltransferase
VPPRIAIFDERRAFVSRFAGDLAVAIQGRFPASAAALALLLGSAPPAHAQTRADCERAYTPQRAQEGKDVIWAPTQDSMVGRMLELAKVTAADKVYDLGAGDGKVVIAAAREFGATGVGIEYDAELVKHARCLAAAERVGDRVTFIQGDIFETDFSDATVVALYLTPPVNQQAAELAGFIGVVVDCLNDGAKRLYQRFDFDEFPGHPMKLFLPKSLLDKLVEG